MHVTHVIVDCIISYILKTFFSLFLSNANSNIQYIEIVNYLLSNMPCTISFYMHILKQNLRNVAKLNN